MAGDMRQTTAIKQNVERFSAENGYFHGRDKDESLKDAAMVPVMVTMFEDSTAKTLRQGTTMVEDAYKVFDIAYKRMIDREIEVEGMVKIHVSKMKDKMGQIADAVAKIEKLTGPGFDTKLERLERFAAAVETLDRLNRTGKLSEVAMSLSKLA